MALNNTLKQVSQTPLLKIIVAVQKVDSSVYQVNFNLAGKHKQNC